MTQEFSYKAILFGSIILISHLGYAGKEDKIGYNFSNTSTNFDDITPENINDNDTTSATATSHSSNSSRTYDTPYKSEEFEKNDKTIDFNVRQSLKELDFHVRQMQKEYDKTGMKPYVPFYRPDKDQKMESLFSGSLLGYNLGVKKNNMTTNNNSFDSKSTFNNDTSNKDTSKSTKDAKIIPTKTYNSEEALIANLEKKFDKSKLKKAFDRSSTDSYFNINKNQNIDLDRKNNTPNSMEKNANKQNTLVQKTESQHSDAHFSDHQKME